MFCYFSSFLLGQGQDERDRTDGPDGTGQDGTDGRFFLATFCYVSQARTTLKNKYSLIFYPGSRIFNL